MTAEMLKKIAKFLVSNVIFGPTVPIESFTKYS